MSLGRHEHALIILEPLLDKFEATPDATEIAVASFLPDAVEALIALGRLAEAEPLIDRAWMLAIGARGRAPNCSSARLIGGNVKKILQQPHWVRP